VCAFCRGQFIKGAVSAVRIDAGARAGHRRLWGAARVTTVVCQWPQPEALGRAGGHFAQGLIGSGNIFDSGTASGVRSRRTVFRWSFAPGPPNDRRLPSVNPPGWAGRQEIRHAHVELGQPLAGRRWKVTWTIWLVLFEHRLRFERPVSPPRPSPHRMGRGRVVGRHTL